MLSVNRIYNMCLLAVEDISSMAGSEIGLDDVEKVMNSEISNEEKTNFFIQYLLAQREPLLNFCKTLVFALVVLLLEENLSICFLK